MCTKLLNAVGVLLVVASTMFGTLPNEACAQQEEKSSPASTVTVNGSELGSYHGEFAALAWSPDGKRLATTTLLGRQFAWIGVEVSVWDTRTMGLRSSNEIEVMPNSVAVALSNDATKVVVASSDDKKVKLDLLGTESGNVVESIEPEVMPTSLAFSPDGQSLAMGTNKIELKSFAEANSVVLANHELPISSFSFSSDGTRVASGSGLFETICGEGLDEVERGEVMIHDVKEGRRVVRLEDPKKPAFAMGVHSVCLSPDGKLLATANSGNVRLWDAETGELTTRLGVPEHANEPIKRDVLYVQTILFSPNGKRLAVAVGNEVDVWDVVSQEIIARLRWHRKAVTALAFSHDSNCLATGGGEVKIWDLRTGSTPLQVTVEPKHTLSGHKSWVRTVAFSPDGEKVVSGCGRAELRFWNQSDGSLLSEHPRIATGRGGAEIKDALYLPDGSLGVAGGPQNGDGIVGVWNSETEALVLIVRPLEFQVQRVLSTPDGETLIAAAYPIIQFFDRETGNQTGAISVRDRAAPYAMDISPDGKLLVTGAPHVQFWSTETHEKISEVEGFYASAVKFSPDGKTVALGSDSRKIQLWSTEQKCLIGEFQSFDGAQSMAFSPDGRLLATGAVSTGRIHLWDTTVRNPVAAPWTNEVAVFDAHPRAHVLSLDFSPDGKTLVSGASDNTAKLWTIDVVEQR